MAIVEGLLALAGKGFLDAASGSIKEEARARLQVFDWNTAQKRYYEKIEKDYGTTHVLGKLDPIPLESIFTDVYLHDKLSAQQRFDIERLHTEPESLELRERFSAFEKVVSGEWQRLYILGKPGAGKTTFLKYVALKASTNEIKKIPIFVSLKDWADSDFELMPFLVKQFDICRFPEAQPLIEYILENGLAIVLFDGLDEAQQEDGKRKKIISDIRDFCRKYDSTQILLTCRIAATDYFFESFNYVEVADFTPEQVESYVQNWFGKDDKKYEQFKNEFERPDNQRLREMVNTPLLLSLLCLNFDETGNIPQRRIEIYEKGIDALLYKWDSTRLVTRDEIYQSVRSDEIYKNLSTGRKQQMFSRIAYETFQRNRYFFRKKELAEMIVDYLRQLPGERAKEDIDGELVLKAIEAQHGILVERAQDIYSFSHLTFQEYFAAKHIVDYAVDGTVITLLTPHKISDSQWREVTLNTASLFNNADSFFKVFRESIDDIINGDETLVRLLLWAESKANQAQTEQKSAVRLFYLCLGLDLDDFFDYDVIFGLARGLDETLAGASEFSSALASNHATEFAFEYEFSDFNYKLESLLKVDFRITVLYLITRLFENNTDYFLETNLWHSFHRLWEETKNDINNNGYNELAEAMGKLYLPLNDTTEEHWNELSHQLQQICLKYCNPLIGFDYWNSQVNILESYFYANNLFVDCLKLAVVSNRKEIEETLFLPPK